MEEEKKVSKLSKFTNSVKEAGKKVKNSNATKVITSKSGRALKSIGKAGASVVSGTEKFLSTQKRFDSLSTIFFIDTFKAKGIFDTKKNIIYVKDGNLFKAELKLTMEDKKVYEVLSVELRAAKYILDKELDLSCDLYAVSVEVWKEEKKTVSSKKK